MYKKLFFSLMIFFGLGFVYGDNPTINSLVVENGRIMVYGSGFSNHTTYEAICGNTGLAFDSLPSDNQINFIDKVDVNSCSFQLNLKKFNSFSGVYDTYTSNSVFLEKKMSTYISSVALNNTGYGYFIRITTNEKLNTIPKVVINSNDVNTNNIFLDQDKTIIVTNFDFKKANYANIYIKVGEKYSNVVTLYLDNKLSFGFDKIERLGRNIKAYFNTSTNGFKVYIDSTEFISGTGIFTIEPSSVVVTFPDNSKTVYDVHFTNGSLKSKHVKLDLSNYFYPYIERLELNEGNFSGAANSLYGVNFYEDDPSKIKIYINGKAFNVYGGEPTSEKPDTLFKFAKMQEIRYNFLQSGQYLIGEKNSIQLEINGRKSNILYFTPGDKSKKDTYYYTGNTSTNIKTTFNTNFITGSNYSNSEIKIGSLSFSSGDKKNYYIKEVKFELNLKDKYEFLPINHIKLGNNYGLINKISDNKYDIIFENYLLENMETQVYDLFVKFSDNLSGVKFELLPKNVTYQFLSYIDDTKYTDKNLDILANSSIIINGNMSTSNCMDVSYDYVNCKKSGYQDKNKITYGVYSGEQLISQINTSINPSISSGSSSIQTTTGSIIMSGNVVKITSNQAEVVLEKLELYVNNKSSNDLQKKKMLYKTLYSKLYTIYKTTGNAQKKALIKSILIGINVKFLGK